MTVFQKYLSAPFVLFCLWPTGFAGAQESFSPDWSSYVGGDYNIDYVSAVVCDTATNCFFGGYLGDNRIHNHEGADFSGDIHAFVAKATAEGTLDWAKDFSSHITYYNNKVTGLAQGKQNSLAAVGVTQGGFADDGTYAFVASLNAVNGDINWFQSIGSSFGTNGFNSVAIDTNGSFYAVGYTSLSNQVCSVPGYQVGSVTYGTEFKGDLDAFVIKYNASGNVEWRHYLGGVNADTAKACTVTPDGYVYVTGETRSPGWASLASGTPSASNAAGFIVKLRTDGTHVWSSFLNGSADDAVNAIRIDTSTASLFLGGVTASSDFLSGSTRLNPFGGSTDGFILKLTDTNTAFHTDWCRFTGGTAADQVSALALMADGRLAAGGSTGAGTWLTQTLGGTFHGVQDGFVTLLTTNGAVSWSAYVGGTNADQVFALAAAPDTLFTVGKTFSPDWVGGGFWDTWTKDEDLNDVVDYVNPFGFIVKWEPGAPIPPSVTSQPADLSVQEGSQATFRVTATGTAPLTYRWLRNSVPVTGLTSNSYSFIGALTNNGDIYSCLVSNVAGTVISSNATLTVTAKPKGSLTVTLAPAAVLTLGAAWSIDDGTTWLASGITTNLSEGTYTVTFKPVEAYAAPATLSSVTVTSGQAATRSVSYTYMLAGRVISGTNITVIVRPPAGTSFWGLIETLPNGLTPTASGDAQWAAPSLTYSGSGTATGTFSYVVSGEPNVYTVSGTVFFFPSNITTNVLGDSTVTIPGPTPPAETPPLPDILAFLPSATPNIFTLTFTSIVAQAYVILTNASPAGTNGWSACLPVTGDGATTRREVPATGPHLFYRVRLVD